MIVYANFRKRNIPRRQRYYCKSCSISFTKSRVSVSKLRFLSRKINPPWNPHSSCSFPFKKHFQVKDAAFCLPHLSPSRKHGIAGPLANKSRHVEVHVVSIKFISMAEGISEVKLQKKEAAGARSGRKVAKHRVFPMFCGSGRSTSRLAKAAGAEPFREMRDEKLHAVAARIAFRSQSAKNTSLSERFWKFRFEKAHAVVAQSTCRSQNAKSTSCSDHFVMSTTPHYTTTTTTTNQPTNQPTQPTNQPTTTATATTTTTTITYYYCYYSNHLSVHQ